MNPLLMKDHPELAYLPHPFPRGTGLDRVEWLELHGFTRTTQMQWLHNRRLSACVFNSLDHHLSRRDGDSRIHLAWMATVFESAVELAKGAA